MEFFTAIEAFPVSTAIRESGWMFPTIETLHVLFLALVLSAIAVVDLRLAGVTLKERGVDDLMRRTLPGAWVSFVGAVITGVMMFASSATHYGANAAFWLKMILLALAGLNMAVFHLGAYRKMHLWDPEALPPIAARAAALISLTLWVGVVLAGRWIGFL
jgi:hypothetical protein